MPGRKPSPPDACPVCGQVGRVVRSTHWPERLCVRCYNARMRRARRAGLTYAEACALAAALLEHELIASPLAVIWQEMLPDDQAALVTAWAAIIAKGHVPPVPAAQHGRWAAWLRDAWRKTREENKQ